MWKLGQVQHKRVRVRVWILMMMLMDLLPGFHPRKIEQGFLPRKTR
jgi:hypothetical protein